MFDMLKDIYKNTTNEVIIEAKRGIRPGCPLSATLLNILIDDTEDG